MVLLRFGSSCDFSKRYMKYGQISSALRVNENTIRTVIKRFRDNGNMLKRDKGETLLEEEK